MDSRDLIFEVKKWIATQELDAWRDRSEAQEANKFRYTNGLAVGSAVGRLDLIAKLKKILDSQE